MAAEVVPTGPAFTCEDACERDDEPGFTSLTFRVFFDGKVEMEWADFNIDGQEEESGVSFAQWSREVVQRMRAEVLGDAEESGQVISVEREIYEKYAAQQIFLAEDSRRQEQEVLDLHVRKMAAIGRLLVTNEEVLNSLSPEILKDILGVLGLDTSSLEDEKAGLVAKILSHELVDGLKG